MSNEGKEMSEGLKGEVLDAQPDTQTDPSKAWLLPTGVVLAFIAVLSIALAQFAELSKEPRGKWCRDQSSEFDDSYSG